MFSTPAYAQTTATTATATAPTGAASIFASPLPMFGLVFVIFYFLVIRPQQKSAAAQKAKIAAVKKGDTVLTAGGKYAKVTKVDDETIEAEIAPGVRVKILKSTLADVQPINPGKPAND